MKVLLLLFVLVHWATCQVLKELVATPVVYGHIHLFLSTSKVLRELDLIEHEMKGLKGLLRASGHAKFLKHVESAESIRKEVLEEKMRQILSSIHPSSAETPSDKKTIKKSRSKRELILIAIGVIALVGLLAFGLSIANRVELESLKTKVQEQDENMRALITTMTVESKEIAKNFQLINDTLVNFERRLDHELVWSTLRHRYRVLDQKLDSYLEGIYSAYKGQIHPSLVSWLDLEQALERLAGYAALQGLKPVRFDNYLEAVFSQPIRVMTNATGLHLVISVPLVPKTLDIMDLYFFNTHHVQFQQGMALEVDLADEVVLADKKRKFLRSMKASTLHSCKKYKSVWLCQVQDFTTRPHSCGTAYLLQDEAKMREFCRTRMVRRGVFFEPVPNGTMVRTHGELIVRRECGNPDQDRTYRVSEEGLIENLPGCQIEAGDYLYVCPSSTTSSLDVSIRNRERLDLGWYLESIEQDFSLEELVQGGHELAELRNLSDVEFTFEEVKRHLSGRTKNIHVAMGWGLSSLSLVLSTLMITCVLARIIQVWRRGSKTETADG